MEPEIFIRELWGRPFPGSATAGTGWQVMWRAPDRQAPATMGVLWDTRSTAVRLQERPETCAPGSVRGHEGVAGQLRGLEKQPSGEGRGIPHSPETGLKWNGVSLPGAVAHCLGL